MHDDQTVMEPAATETIEEIADLRRQLAESAAALATADMRTAVAIAITPEIRQYVESEVRLSIVAEEIVDCWHLLSPDVRQQYNHHPLAPGVVVFAYDYCETVTTAWITPAGADGDAIHGEPREDMCRHSWTIHVAEIGQRIILRRSPDPSWLEQFPLPVEEHPRPRNRQA